MQQQAGKPSSGEPRESEILQPPDCTEDNRGCRSLSGKQSGLAKTHQGVREEIAVSANAARPAPNGRNEIAWWMDFAPPSLAAPGRRGLTT